MVDWILMLFISLVMHDHSFVETFSLSFLWFGLDNSAAIVVVSTKNIMHKKLTIASYRIIETNIIPGVVWVGRYISEII